jgi:hypothetical protein
MRIVSWDAEGFKSVKLVPQAETITAARYLQPLRNLRPTLHDRSPGKRGMIMPHEKTRGPAVLVGAWRGGLRMPENFRINPTVRT